VSPAPSGDKKAPVPAWVVSAAIVILITLLTWPVASIRPQYGLDPSWGFGLHRGAELGLRWGRDVVFTYGPLGFLTVPALWSTPTLVLGLAWAALQWGALAATIFSLLRRFGPTVAAAAGTWALMAASPLPIAEVTPALVCLWGVGITQGTFTPRQQQLLLPAGAVLAGVDLLVKFSSGVVCAAVVLIASWAVRNSWRSVAKTICLMTAGLLLAWGVASRSFWGLVPYLRRSAEVAAGYTEAMWLDSAPFIGYPLFLIVVAGFGVLLGLHGTPGKRLALLAVVAIALFMFGKQSFVRYDIYHAPIVFALATVLPLALGRPTSRLTGGLCLLTVAVSGVAMFAVARHAGIRAVRAWPSHVRNPAASAADAFGQTRTILTSRRFELQSAARANIVQELGLDDLPKGIFHDHSAHVDPWATSAIWALQLRWRPLPVFQSYAAYTADLDDINARALSSGEGPQRILRLESRPVAGRNRVWESPASMLAMLCHYDQEIAGAGWQILRQIPNRCGSARRLSGADHLGGEAVPIPPGGDNELVFARLHLRQSQVERLSNTLFRPQSYPVVLLDGTERHRLVPATAGQSLLLRVPPAWGFSPDYERAVSKQTLALTAAGGGARVEFWAVPLSGAPAP
jgi:hypothetical protein